MNVDGFLSEDTQKGRDVVREEYSDCFRFGDEEGSGLGARG